MADISSVNTPPTKPTYSVSMTGIVVALSILIIFLLIATFLSSVFVGLLLAFITFPIQQYFYRKLFVKPRYLKMLERKEIITERLYTLKENTPLALRVRRAAASHSAVFSFIIFLFGVLILGVGIYFASFHAGKSLRNYSDTMVQEEKAYEQAEKENRHREMIRDIGGDPTTLALPQAIQTDSSQKTYIETLASALSRKIESLRSTLASNAYMKPYLDRLSEVMKEQDTQEKLTFWVIATLEGFFPNLFGVFRSSVQFLVSLFLSLVFCALFLQLFAKAVVTARYYVEERHALSGENVESKPPSYYLINLMFSSDWFPNLSERARSESVQILEEVVRKMRAWIHGYLLVVVIEIPLYILIFSILGIPYAVVLGILSGCTIFVPCIGPVLVFGTAFLAMCTAPSVSAFQILGVAVTYILVWGALENLFLYPKLVGGRLGLTFIETLSVVLLGGYLFGLLGLLLALPVAAILKYLIPQVWRCWAGEKKDSDYSDVTPSGSHD